MKHIIQELNTLLLCYHKPNNLYQTMAQVEEAVRLANNFTSSQNQDILNKQDATMSLKMLAKKKIKCNNCACFQLFCSLNTGITGAVILTVFDC